MDWLMRLYRKHVRINNFWKKYIHDQIDITHRILEYLEPDHDFKPKDLKDYIMDEFLSGNVTNAVSYIIDELGIDVSDEYHTLEVDAVEFAEEVLKDFNEKQKKNKMNEREELLARLAELNKELGI